MQEGISKFSYGFWDSSMIQILIFNLIELHFQHQVKKKKKKSATLGFAGLT